jgi:hypothetical protein
MAHTKAISSIPEETGFQLKAAIQVTLQDGTILEGTAALTAKQAVRSKAPKVSPSKSVPDAVTSLDFSIPLRPFMKTYGKKLRGGQKKLTLLVAHLCKGNVDVPVSRIEVEERWSKMTALMGGPYNGAYDTRARDQGWIHSPKAGSFALRGGWEAVLR